MILIVTVNERIIKDSHFQNESSCKVASGSFSPKVIISLVPRELDGPLRPPELKKFFESNLNIEGFHEVSRIIARPGTAHGTSGIITFGEKDPEATLLTEEVLLFPKAYSNGLRNL